MTAQGWITFAIIAGIAMATAIGIGVWALNDLESKKGFVGAILAGIVIVVVMLGGMLFYYNRTEPGKRAFHTQQSEWGGGMDRTVRVYDVQGDLIAEYSGRFDVDYDEERIIFDDEDGLRHIIYFSVSTVIIDEEGEE